MLMGVGGGGGVEGRTCVRARARANGSLPLRGALTARRTTPPATPCTGLVAQCAARLLIIWGAEGGEATHKL